MFYTPIKNTDEEWETSIYYLPLCRFSLSHRTGREIECIEGKSYAMAFPKHYHVQQHCIMSKIWHGSQWHIC